ENQYPCLFQKLSVTALFTFLLPTSWSMNPLKVQSNSTGICSFSFSATFFKYLRYFLSSRSVWSYASGLRIIYIPLLVLMRCLFFLFSLSFRFLSSLSIFLATSAKFLHF